MKTKTFFNTIMYIIKGIMIGTGAILPGVSGGVLCVAFGIYEPMMSLLTHPIKSFKSYYKMFIPLIIGLIIGFIFLAKVVEYFFSVSETVALMLFFGLICGTIPELFKVSEKSDSTKSWTPFVISLSLAYLLFHILENGINTTIAPSFLSYCLCGLVWGLSLIIPGLSSSTILIYLGIYEPMTSGIGSLNFSVILPLFIGIALTALIFARFVNMLFEKHYTLISRIILGFIISSSLTIIPSSFETPLILIISLACFAGGFILARTMDVIKEKQKE